MSASGSSSAPQGLQYRYDKEDKDEDKVVGEAFPVIDPDESWWVTVARSLDNIRKLTGYTTEERAEAVLDTCEDPNSPLPPSFMTSDHKLAALWIQRYGHGNRGTASFNIQQHIRVLKGLPCMVSSPVFSGVG